MVNLNAAQLWEAINREIFAVVGMVSAKNEAKTVGVVYAVYDRKLYFSSTTDAWKVRHIRQNPHVSVTIPIAKRIPFWPWVKIPAATITASGTARVLTRADAPPEVEKKLLRGIEDSPEAQGDFAVIEIEPAGNFVTYGVGVSLMGMRDTINARGRVPVKP